MSKPNYQEAFDELQQIVSEMEGGQITVDELSKKVARAAQLIRICKSKLTQAEQNVQEILDTIDKQEIMDEPETSGESESEEENNEQENNENIQMGEEDEFADE